jgi:hypothetical protein
MIIQHQFKGIPEAFVIQLLKHRANSLIGEWYIGPITQFHIGFSLKINNNPSYKYDIHFKTC